MVFDHCIFSLMDNIIYIVYNHLMWSVQELTRAINNHLSCEFQASHTYLAMSIWLRERDLAGFSSYMQTKSQEERGHADRLIAYLVDCDEQVELPSVEAPQRTWTSAQTLFDDVYEMEQAVTASINRIYSIAEQAGESNLEFSERPIDEDDGIFTCAEAELLKNGWVGLSTHHHGRITSWRELRSKSIKSIGIWREYDW